MFCSQTQTGPWRLHQTQVPFCFVLNHKQVPGDSTKHRFHFVLFSTTNRSLATPPNTGSILFCSQPQTGPWRLHQTQVPFCFVLNHKQVPGDSTKHRFHFVLFSTTNRSLATPPSSSCSTAAATVSLHVRARTRMYMCACTCVLNFYFTLSLRRRTIFSSGTLLRMCVRARRCVYMRVCARMCVLFW